MVKYKLTWAERGYTAYPHESEHSTFIGAISAATIAAAAYDVVEIKIIKRMKIFLNIPILIPDRIFFVMNIEAKVMTDKENKQIRLWKKKKL